MQNFKELYKELGDLISQNIESVKWVDLWNSQVYNLENEHPFPAPAIFLAFRSNNMTDGGAKMQNVNMQVDVFVFYETFLDTFKGAYNQDEALEFLDILDQVNKILHGSNGTNYSSMRRTSFSPIDTGGSGNLWNVTYNCTLIDYSATEEFVEGGFSGVTVSSNNNYDLP